MPRPTDHRDRRSPRSQRQDEPAGQAWFRGVEARGAVQCVDLRAEAGTVAEGGFWAVVGDFEGTVQAWRFGHVTRATPAPGPPGAPPAGATAQDRWSGPAHGAWASSLDRDAYLAAVQRVRDAVRAGDVYQANLCRVLSAPLAVRATSLVGSPAGPSAGPAGEPSARALAGVLAAGNPAPYAGGVHVPAATGLPPAWVVTASPELYLRLADGVLTSAPIKGTASTAEGLTAKDRAENVMITDLVRNDLQRVCAPGSVEVTSLLGLEEHPGLVHLVSTVRGRLADGVATSDRLWAHLLDATYPPGSVSGAPKSSALDLIAALEPVPRGPYCGVVGWIDADAGRAELAVGIRTFWWADGMLRFGTGAGITWGSDPHAEWAETELKARRLIALASAPD